MITITSIRALRNGKVQEAFDFDFELETIHCFIAFSLVAELLIQGQSVSSWIWSNLPIVKTIMAVNFIYTSPTNTTTTEALGYLFECCSIRGRR